MQSLAMHRCITIFVILSMVTYSPSGSAAPAWCEKLLTFVKSEAVQKRVRYYNPLKIDSKMVLAAKLLGQKFYEPSEKGAVVGISGYSGPRSNINRANGDFLAGKPFADGERVFNFSVETPVEILSVLMEVYRKSGPIHRLALLGHGTPGDIHIGEEFLAQKWDKLDSEVWDALPKDLFVKDAEIVLLSCNCAQGNLFSPNGNSNKLRTLFGKLAKNGATLYASRQFVLFTTDGFLSTKEVRETRAEFEKAKVANSAALVAITLALLPLIVLLNTFRSITVDSKSKYDPIDVIAIPPSM